MRRLSRQGLIRNHLRKIYGSTEKVLERKYIYRRGLEGLVVARIIAFTWYQKSRQTGCGVYLGGGTTALEYVSRGGR